VRRDAAVGIGQGPDRDLFGTEAVQTNARSPEPLGEMLQPGIVLRGILRQPESGASASHHDRLDEPKTWSLFLVARWCSRRPAPGSHGYAA